MSLDVPGYVTASGQDRGIVQPRGSEAPRQFASGTLQKPDQTPGTNGQAAGMLRKPHRDRKRLECELQLS